MRVTRVITPPNELPAYNAEKGPYIMLMLSISSGVTIPQRGEPKLPCRKLDSSTPSAYNMFCALASEPTVRVAILPLRSPIKRSRTCILGIYFKVCEEVAALRFSSICFLSKVSTVAGCLRIRLSIIGARTTTASSSI